MGYQKLTPILPDGASEARYIGTRCADSLSVKDFGAKGDGTTDDTAAFEAAAATGKSIFVPKGTYNVSKSVAGNFYSHDAVQFSDAVVEVLCTAYAGQQTRKAVRFVSDWQFPDYAAAVAQVRAISTSAGAHLYPQACCHGVKDGVERIYVYYESMGNGAQTTNALVIFNITDNEYEKYYILKNSYSGEGIAYTKSGDDEFIYVCSSYQSNAKTKYKLAGDSGSELEAIVDDICEISGGFPFFSRSDAGEWLIYGGGDQSTNGANVLSIYNDSAQYITQIAWNKWDFDYLTGQNTDNAWQYAVPHKQGLFYDSGNLYIFAGGSSSGTRTNASDIGVIHKGINGYTRRNNICKSLKAESLFASMFNKAVDHIENEGGYVYKGKVYSLDMVFFANSGGNKIFLLEEFSQSANSVDFTSALASQPNALMSSSRKFYPKSVGGVFKDPFTNDTLTSFNDFITMMARYGIEELAFNLNGTSIPPSVTVYPDGSDTTTTYYFNESVENSPFCVKIIHQTAWTYIVEFITRGLISYHSLYTNSALQVRFAAPMAYSSNSFYMAFTDSFILHGKIPGQTYSFALAKLSNGVVGNQIAIGEGASSRPQAITLSCSTASAGESDGDNYAVLLYNKALRPNAANSITLGDGTYRWKDIYVNSATLTGSDARIKDEVEDIDERVLSAWGEVRLRVFKFIDSVKKKGSENARIHAGVIAQEVQQAFASKGLDANRYGLFCYDEWEDQYEDEVIPETEDENGIPRTERKLVMKAGNMFSIRYEEALVLECAYLRWRLEKLEERVDQLTSQNNG